MSTKSLQALGLFLLLPFYDLPAAHAAPWTAADVASRASLRGPAAQAAERRAEALRAQTAGQTMLAPVNPALSLSVGPHWSNPPQHQLALYGRLSWPLE